MSVSPRSAYIHTLDDDALLHIFTINGDMFLYPHALRTTRTTSQVCQRWRTLMLDTPSLWAKLIDVDCISFAMNSVEWRKELMKRTGTALLWIRVESIRKTQPAEPSEHIRTFFFDTVRENWHRLQRLEMTIRVDTIFHPSSWITFGRPAPVLETFNVTFERMGPQHAEDPADIPLSTLFSGCAPMLRTFILTCFTIAQGAPWLCHLHSMEIDGNTYNVRLLLDILSSTHCLRELKIEDLRHEDISTPLPIASLPHLNYLGYRGNSQEGSILLDHIQIPSDCWLHVPGSNMENPKPATEEQYLSIATTFIQYLQRYLQSYVPHSIELGHFSDHSIHVQIGTKHPTYTYYTPLDISFPLYKRGGSSVHSRILEKLALEEFSVIAHLKLSCGYPFNPAMASFFRCFTSLRGISTNSQTLRYLTELQDNLNDTNKKITLFPLLEYIVLFDDFVVSRKDIFKVDTATAGFILMRIRDGHPVTKLHLPSYCCTVAPDLEALAGAKGLKVLYTRRNANIFGKNDEESNEYICGGV